MRNLKTNLPAGFVASDFYDEIKTKIKVESGNIVIQAFHKKWKTVRDGKNLSVEVYTIGEHIFLNVIEI